MAPLVRKFKPERSIYLNTQNTSLKTKAEVEEACEKLRNETLIGGDHNWLCKYEEVSRPITMSFNNPQEFDAFRKDCASLGFTLSGSVIAEDSEDFADIDASANPNVAMAHAEESDTDSVQHSDGRVTSNKKKK